MLNVSIRRSNMVIMLSSILSYLIILGIMSCGAIRVNKCCSQNEMFRIKGSDLICVPVEDPLSEYYWLPENLNSSILENLEVNFNTIPCRVNRALLSEEFNVTIVGNSLVVNDTDIFTEKSFCLEYLKDRQNVLAYECPCLDNVCIFKCCESGYHIKKSIDSTKCEESVNGTDWSYDLIDGANKIYHTMYETHDCKAMNKTSKYLILSYKLLENGSIHSDVDGIIDPNEYCGDHIEENDGLRVARVIACIKKSVVTLESKVYGALSITGAIFLFMSAIILFWMPEIGGSPRWSLFLQVVSLLVAYLSLAYQQLSPQYFGKTFCKTIGFVMQFSFLAAFFWLNVMCIDLAWTFSSIRAPSQQKQAKRKRFMWYSLYAWGGSSIISLAAIVVEFTSYVSEYSSFKPNLAVVKCWFKDKNAIWLYFFGPIGILLLFNLILFIFTLFKIILLKRGTKALRSDDNNATNSKMENRQRYLLYFKMFMLMGVSWLTEIISWAIDSKDSWKVVWYITDTFNMMRAIFIFVMFCCKEKVWMKMKNDVPGLAKTEIYVLNLFNKTVSNEDELKERRTVTTSDGIISSVSENNQNSVSEIQNGIEKNK